MRLLLLVLFFIPSLSFAQDPFEKNRLRMVREQIAERDIRDTATLRALRSVPRHKFVSSTYVEEAYDDNPLPIGYGQTISQPYIVAYMTELVNPKRGMRVLEIGTGSGYQAAILAEIVDTVYTIEIIPQLGKTAGERLKSLGYSNIHTRTGDGYFGWKEAAPFDAILVTAAAEHIPPPLITQMKDGGKMVIPVGSPFFVQTLMLVEKHGSDIKTRSLFPVRFVPLARSD